MNFTRLHALSDGIFAIAMTLLVLELKVPALEPPVTNQSLWQALVSEWRLFFAFIISFVLSFTYWRAHTVLMGSWAKNPDAGLIQINMVFLMLVSLLPFSTSLLSQYQTTQVGIGLYVAHIAVLGLVVYWMRQYCIRHDSIKVSDWTSRDHRNANVRTVVPTLACLAALIASFWSSALALGMIVLVAFLNLFSWGFEPIFQLLDHWRVGLD